MEIVIYAAISDHEPLGQIDTFLAELKGLNGSYLYTIYFEDIVVVVSNIHKADLKVNEVNALLFAGIIEKLAAHFTLVPMRFGSLMDTKESVFKMLERNYNAFQQNLIKVQGRSEFGMKIIFKPKNMDAFLSTYGASKNEYEAIPASGINTSVFRAYVNQKLIEHRKEERLMTYIESLIATILQSISQLNILSKFTKKVNGTYLIDAVFLVNMKQRPQLMQVVEIFQKDHPELNFIVTGPWPAYSFVDISLK